jgi:hypothetical protein
MRFVAGCLTALHGKLAPLWERNGRFGRFCCMPIFFFHLRVGPRAELDSHGVDLPDLAAAKRHAIVTAPDRVRGRVRRTDDPSSWRIEIADAAGQYLATVNCDGVLASG